MQKIFKETFLSPYRSSRSSGSTAATVSGMAACSTKCDPRRASLRRRQASLPAPVMPELHHYLLENDAASKKATVAGWLFLEQDGDGWKTVPLTPGPQ